MSWLLAGLILIPLLDQGLKRLLIERLGPRSVSLGPLGALEIVRTRIWLARISRSTPPPVWWMAWVLAAGALVTVTIWMPGAGWGAGLLLGGSLSHVWESATRGWICDYVRLRFWPAFNLADLAICGGAAGLVLEAVSVGTGHAA